MRGLTLFRFLCLLLSYTSWGQVSTSLFEQLHEIETLIDQQDPLAIQILDQIKEEAVHHGNDTIAVRYHKLRGDYYLSLDQFKQAAEAYAPLLSYNHLNFPRSISGKLARGINDLGIALMRIGEFDQAQQAHHKSLGIYEKLEDPQGAAFNYNNLAVLFQNLKLRDSALHNFSKSLEYAVLAKDTIGVAFNNQNLGILYGNMNDPVNSIEHYQKALIAFEHVEMTSSAMYCLKGIGFEYTKVGDLDSARKYLTVNFNYHLNHGSPRQKAGAISAMGELMNKVNELDSAVYYYQSALQRYETINYKYGIAKTHSLIGINYTNNEAYDSAIYHLNFSLGISENFKGILEASHVRLGDISMKRRQYKTAVFHAKKALDASNGNPTTGHLSLIYETMYKSYDQLGDLKNAYKYLRRFSEAREKISGRTRALELARIETKLAHEKTINQQREKNLQREFLLEKRVLLERGLGMAVSIFLGLLLTFVILQYRNKGRRNLKLLEQNKIIESQKLQLERATYKERKLLNDQLQAKDRELAILAMQSNEKNEILKKLKEKMDLRTDGKSTKEIKKLIESNLALDNSWDNFLNKFEDVYPKFFSKMKVEYESLSVNQLKLCAYIKVGMDNSEISKVTNIEMSSVKKNLNRLKKKLDLGPEDSIRTFVMNYV